MRAAVAMREGDVELAASGAERGAAALAGLLGGEVRAGRIHAPGRQELAGCESGVFFALDGAIEGAVALLFPPAARDALLRALGDTALADPASALAEVANIVASQAACAVAELRGERVRLSVPRLVARGAGAALAHAIGDGPAFASELGPPAGGVRALFVLVPGAPPSGCDTVAG
jgi:hypothetical protein